MSGKPGLNGFNVSVFSYSLVKYSIVKTNGEITFNLRIARGEFSNGICFSLPLHEPGLHARVMHLAARIVAVDPEPHSIAIIFGDVVIAPDLITNPDFREFAKCLDVAMPSWPARLVRNSPLISLLVLAPLKNLSISHHAGSGSWLVSVQQDDLERRITDLSDKSGRLFTLEERRQLMRILAEDVVGE